MKWRIGVLIALVLAAGAAVLALALYPAGDSGRGARPSSPNAIPLAIVGDSGSHSYHDRISFPPGSPERGGAFRPRTFLWTEIIARLRGQELDLGPWVVWGRPPWVAWGREILGMEGGRAPKKEDYLYNFAFSGAGCTNLMGVGYRQRLHQVPRLIAMMDRDPELWKKGIVVIRIGINDWAPSLDLQAHSPNAPEVRSVIDFCAGEIGKSLARIHASHPETRVLVVGLAVDTADPEIRQNWPTVQEIDNLELAVGNFNAAVRKVVASAPGAAYFDDAAWSARHWGKRAAGEVNPAVSIEIGNRFKVTNTSGDDPHNALLADDHAGLAWNALWAQYLVERLHEAFGLPLKPISDEEVAAFVLPLVEPTK